MILYIQPSLGSQSRSFGLFSWSWCWSWEANKFLVVLVKGSVEAAVGAVEAWIEIWSKNYDLLKQGRKALF